MTRCVIDTNVPIVANGRPDISRGGQAPSIECRTAAVEFLIKLLRSGRILLDSAGAIQSEYHRHLNPSGQPGVGDRFYQAVITSLPDRVERVELPKRADVDAEYVDLPQILIDAGFDPSDRKFAALAKRARVPVVNAVDSRSWLRHYELLSANDIHVIFICGCDEGRWFASEPNATAGSRQQHRRRQNPRRTAG